VYATRDMRRVEEGERAHSKKQGSVQSGEGKNKKVRNIKYQRQKTTNLFDKRKREVDTKKEALCLCLPNQKNKRSAAKNERL